MTRTQAVGHERPPTDRTPAPGAGCGADLVDRDGARVEVAECGLAHPRDPERAGLDSSWSGLAPGVGPDRIRMLPEGIPDICLPRSPIRCAVTDLAQHRPVPAMLAIRRDLSVAGDGDDLAEDVRDHVRDALGPDADRVGTVSILSQTPCADPPPRVLERFGARRDPSFSTSSHGTSSAPSPTTTPMPFGARPRGRRRPPARRAPVGSHLPVTRCAQGRRSFNAASISPPVRSR
ncbi:hypothetical protein [Streptomyces sp. NPDC058701]|uniref:tRNA ligase subunit PheS family protein n=1 Tax=Streptomyces sp. NPDC058701 TaxID=3346608 RepID=UPI0036461A74